MVLEFLNLKDGGFYGGKSRSCLCKQSVLNYAFWSKEEVRIKYSEVHTQLTRVGYDVVSKDYVRFIVLKIDLKSGFVQIFLDPAAEVHPHVDDSGATPERAYEQYYFDKASRLLGDMHDFDISLKANLVLQLEPQLLKPVGLDGQDAKGFGIKVTSPGLRDAKDSDGYGSIQKNPKKYIDAVWLTEPSGDKLDRQLRMWIYPTEAKLAFRRDCLASEIEYVISVLRDIQETKPDASKSS